MKQVDVQMETWTLYVGLYVGCILVKNSAAIKRRSSLVLGEEGDGMVDFTKASTRSIRGQNAR